MTNDRLFKQKAPKIMRQLMEEFDLTDVQAAGILGNIGHECTGFHELHERGQPENKGGYGWAQWTGPRRVAFFAWCKKHDLEWQTDDANYGFLKNELESSERRAISAVSKTSNLEEAVKTFERKFERAGVPHYESRNRWARIALSTFHGDTSAHTVAVPGGTAPLPQPKPGRAVISGPTPVTAKGELFEVDVQQSPLRLRSEPKVDNNNANVKTRLPDGHIVQAVTGKDVDGFLEVETDLLGAHFHGYVSAQYLKPAPAAVTKVPPTIPSPTPPTSGIVAVYMPRKAGTITKRTDKAGAHSLNEPGQPERQGSTPDDLRNDLTAIINWLAVDNPKHLRYQPNSISTFCNIYAHDYCHLAGVYLPRVWWSQAAIMDLARGKSVQPLYGKTIDELRANDLFRWLRDFGPDFDWRQTSTLTKLQTGVNQGGIGLIVARRVLDGKSGHIVAVVPETNAKKAKRNSAGDVTAPLQGQAGARNFRYGTGKQDWWKGAQFAESAFWLHA